MTLRYSLLDEPLIGVRRAGEGTRTGVSLPELLAAMAADRIGDFPAVRPHQRHPWHAFLVQLAVMAMHRAGAADPFDQADPWKRALLALTPADPDGAAWCLIAPHDRPALLQAPVPGADLEGWKNDQPTPDSLDILITSKNHELKQERMVRAAPEDWIYALVSLQTAAPYPGRGNFGIARMNGGSSSRPGVGIVPPGGPGRRWLRDVSIGIEQRTRLIETFGYRDSDGVQLLWLQPWDGKAAYSFAQLDPFFIEISRRIRLTERHRRITALRTASTGPRIAKQEARTRKGNTGDLWTPVEAKEGKSLGVSAQGFHYKRMVELMFGAAYKRPAAQIAHRNDDAEGLTILACAIAGGQSTTDGYHQRRVPTTRTVRKMLIRRRTDRLAEVAGERVDAIAALRGLLWSALLALFDNGARRDGGKAADTAQTQANRFVAPFEQGEDARFFDGPLGLNAEIEAERPEQVRLRWYLSMAERAAAILEDAFDAGPRSGEQRYRARAAALARFHGGLRSDRVLPTLAQYYRDQTRRKEPAHDEH